MPKGQKISAALIGGLITLLVSSIFWGFKVIPSESEVNGKLDAIYSKIDAKIDSKVDIIKYNHDHDSLIYYVKDMSKKVDWLQRHAGK